jgi:hypothetical protein
MGAGAADAPAKKLMLFTSNRRSSSASTSHSVACDRMGGWENEECTGGGQKANGKEGRLLPGWKTIKGEGEERRREEKRGEERRRRKEKGKSHSDGLQRTGITMVVIPDPSSAVKPASGENF